MSIVRASLAALGAQLAAEPKRLMVMTEGESDRFAIAKWARDKSLSIDAYHVQDFEIDIDAKWVEYGGNKGRICTAFDNDEIVDFADKNAVGIVDRDVDGIIRDLVDVAGVYYAVGGSFFCFLFSKPKIENILETSFKKAPAKSIIDATIDFGKRALALKSFLQDMEEPIKPVAIKKYMSSDKEQNYFAWDEYLKATANKTPFSKDDISNFISANCSEDDVCIDYHLAVEFLCLCGKKIGLFAKSVQVDELRRHIERAFFDFTDECELRQLLTEKEASIKA